jgi:hypothetical protein
MRIKHDTSYSPSWLPRVDIKVAHKTRSYPHVVKNDASVPCAPKQVFVMAIFTLDLWNDQQDAMAIADIGRK